MWFQLHTCTYTYTHIFINAQNLIALITTINIIIFKLYIIIITPLCIKNWPITIWHCASNFLLQRITYFKLLFSPLTSVHLVIPVPISKQNKRLDNVNEKHQKHKVLMFISIFSICSITCLLWFLHFEMDDLRPISTLGY